MRRQRGTAWLLVFAIAMFAVAYTVPHLPHLYGGRSRGEAEIAPEIMRHGRRTPIDGVARISSRDRVAVRYIPAGYLYLWIVGIRANRTLVPLVPGPADALLTYGWRAETQGGTVYLPEKAGIGEGRLAVFALLSPLPWKFEDLELAVKESEEKDPLSIARNLHFTGHKHVFEIERVTTTATTAR